MSRPVASTVDVQLHACGRLAIVRAPGQKPLHLDREGARRMLERLQEAVPQMTASPTAADNHPRLPLP